MMNKLGDLYKTASATFGVLPGIAILLTNLGVPPDASKLLFAGTIEAIGVLTLLTLWTNKEKIKGFTAQKITRFIIISTGIFLVSLFFYLFLFGQYVVQVSHSNPLLFPFWPQDELKEGLIHYGSKVTLIQNWGADDVYKVIQSSSPVSVQLTTLILLFNYLIVFFSITFAFGILGIKNSVSED